MYNLFLIASLVALWAVLTLGMLAAAGGWFAKAFFVGAMMAAGAVAAVYFSRGRPNSSR